MKAACGRLFMSYGTARLCLETVLSGEDMRMHAVIDWNVDAAKPA